MSDSFLLLLGTCLCLCSLIVFFKSLNVPESSKSVVGKALDSVPTQILVIVAWVAGALLVLHLSTSMLRDGFTVVRSVFGLVVLGLMAFSYICSRHVFQGSDVRRQ